jgi:hypothetical protein
VPKKIKIVTNYVIGLSGVFHFRWYRASWKDKKEKALHFKEGRGDERVSCKEIAYANYKLTRYLRD